MLAKTRMTESRLNVRSGMQYMFKYALSISGAGSGNPYSCCELCARYTRAGSRDDQSLSQSPDLCKMGFA
jgi:hypothetical protein